MPFLLNYIVNIACRIHNFHTEKKCQSYTLIWCIFEKDIFYSKGIFAKNIFVMVYDIKETLFVDCAEFSGYISKH